MIKVESTELGVPEEIPTGEFLKFPLFVEVYYFEKLYQLVSHLFELPVYLFLRHVTIPLKKKTMVL